MKKPAIAVIALLACVGASSPTLAARGPQIAFDEELHNFGVIAEESTVTHVFRYKNTGDAPLTLSGVSASCECMNLSWSKAALAPGKAAEIKVTYDSRGRPGAFSKTVSFYINGQEPNSVRVLMIKGQTATRRGR